MLQAAFYGDWGVSPTSRKSLSCHESPACRRVGSKKIVQNLEELSIDFVRFMTIKQASEKWGICTRRVQTLCTEGRIDGAERLGHQWVIPINAEKPKDARIKSGRYIKTKSGNGENEDGKKTV